MESESFRERNRRRREENAFENLYAYAREAQIPDPKGAAERMARRLHSDAPESETSNTREPNTDDTRERVTEKVPHRLEDRTKDQLYARAQELNIEGRSQMLKDDLIAAIREHQ